MVLRNLLLYHQARTDSGTVQLRLKTHPPDRHWIFQSRSLHQLHSHDRSHYPQNIPKNGLVCCSAVHHLLDRLLLSQSIRVQSSESQLAHVSRPILIQSLQVRKSLNSSIPGTCLPYAPVNYVVSGFNIFLDLLIFSLPIPLFLNMKVDLRLRLQLSFLFSLGLLVTICSIVKITYIMSIAKGHDATPFVILSSLEINVGVSIVA